MPSNEANAVSAPAPRRSSRVRKPARVLQLATAHDPERNRKIAKRERANSTSTSKPPKKKTKGRKPDARPTSTPDNEEHGGTVNEPNPTLQQDSSDVRPTENEKSTSDVLTSQPSVIPERAWGQLEDPRKLKIVTWNVASCRSMIKNGSLLQYISRESPDALCLQETKMTEKALEDFPNIDGYDVHWNHSEKKGYSGVATLIRQDLPDQKKVTIDRVERGIGLPEADNEGRVLTCYFANSIALVNAYVPNSGGKLARLGFRTTTFEPAMREFLNGLAENHQVIYCGDLNVAHMEIDIHNSKGNQKSAGHTPEERHEFSKLLVSGGGWIDSFRELNPGVPGYTYFSRRFGPRLKTEGKGWRLDYHVLDAASFKRGVISDVYIRVDVEGSDHYPLVLEYHT